MYKTKVTARMANFTSYAWHIIRNVDEQPYDSKLPVVINKTGNILHKMLIVKEDGRAPDYFDDNNYSIN
jgi:hypothetical protein